MLGILPGEQRLDLDAVKALLRARYVSFASADAAERLGGCPVGTILPFVFHPDLELIVDPSVRDIPEVYFNAGRLDRSLALRTSDYFAIARPRVAPIAQAAPIGRLH